jgi:hypothetical protein
MNSIDSGMYFIIIVHGLSEIFIYLYITLFVKYYCNPFAHISMYLICLSLINLISLAILTLPK